ncbi:hypothetical protein [Vineibacter terrae]|uniref:hypothetical protein n=1 Tax=Vineibacter terrae TaxID=2586908 RepID=UPI002E318F10|nr:hypothetical protein [Vineibacter terrae]HEX2887421.1 hypothetical protein [Vineibacter terrae]
MRVSVIVTMPAHAPLRAQSSNAFSMEALAFNITEPTKRGDLVLDPSFPPAAAGSENSRGRQPCRRHRPRRAGVRRPWHHRRGSQAFGQGTPDSGTSTACPVAAGCVAAIRTRLAPGNATPNALFVQFRANAAPKPSPRPGWNHDYGAGIIRPVAIASHYGL